MSSFFELVKFEYKKILRKKINIITLFLGIILTIVSAVGTLLGNYYIDGKVFESNYEGMKKNREYSRNLSGREINSDLFSETIEAYSKIPFFEGRYTDTEEYQKYARQYSEIYHIIRRVYNINNMREISSIKKESLNNFYTIRQNLVEKAIDNTYMTEKEKVSSINLSRKVNIPFIYSYTGGYNKFFATMYPVAFLICFICTICISPLFAGEYSERMDSLIFSSKYGKSKMIWAKIFTGISFTVLICIVFTIVSYLTVMIFFGWDGIDSPIQLLFPLSIVPFTMGQIALLYSILILFGNLLSSSLTMVLSAKLKSPFIVLAIMTAITIIPGFINASEDVLWIYHLYNLIPARMFNITNIISIYSIDFLGLTLQPYVFIISFAIIASITLIPLVYRTYKKVN